MSSTCQKKARETHFTSSLNLSTRPIFHFVCLCCSNYFHFFFVCVLTSCIPCLVQMMSRWFKQFGPSYSPVFHTFLNYSGIRHICADQLTGRMPIYINHNGLTARTLRILEVSMCGRYKYHEHLFKTTCLLPLVSPV